LALSAKMKIKNTDENFLASLEFDFFKFNSSILFEYSRISVSFSQ